MYFYILLDKFNKTAKVINALSCLASNYSVLETEYKITRGEALNRFKLVFTNTDNSFDLLPKKYNNFKKI